MTQAMSGLDRGDLTQLRRRISGQLLLQAARNNAGRDVVEPFLALLDAIDRCIDQRDETPTVQQCQFVADKGPTIRHSGGGRHGRNGGTAVP